MKNKKTALLISMFPTIAFCNQSFYSVIGNDDFKVTETLKKEYSAWVDVGSPTCEVDLEESEVYFGKTFTQTEFCDQKQERTVTTKSVDKDGNETVVSEIKEYQNIELPETETDLVGTHLEKSCNNIIKNDYASDDGIYRIGEENDNFDVYCDMRTNEGWTLIAKVNTSNIDNIHEPKNWFLNGSNESSILYSTITINAGLESLGINKISKIEKTGVAEFNILSQDMTDEVNLYKEVTESNLSTWFVGNETTATKTCTDSGLTQNCEQSQFYNGSTYVLDQMNLNKVGFSTTGDLHFRFNESDSPYYSSLCSYTFNYDNNAWGDTMREHWGNALRIYIK